MKSELLCQSLPLRTSSFAGIDVSINKLSQLGIMVGQAFQIQDDIIGIFDSQKNIGKSILSDLAESKKTLLMIHTFQKLRGAKRKTFLKYFNKPKKTYQDLVAVRKILISAGSLEYNLNQVKTRIDKTLKILKQLKMKEKYRNVVQSAILQLFKHSARIAEKNNINIPITS